MNLSSLSARRAALIGPLFLACLAGAALLSQAAAGAATLQGSGTSASESRSVAEFHAIAVSGSIDLVVRQGQASVQVQADDNLLPLLETVVESSGSGALTLQVRWKKGHGVRTRSKVLVQVANPLLTSLAGTGSGDVRLEAFNTPALRISMSGSGDVRIDKLSTEALEIGLSGSGDVAGNGRASRLKVGIAGSGDVNFDALQADEASVHIAGSGDAAVHAQKTLAVSIVGSGDVRYAGSPALKTSVAGSGSVRKK